MLRRGISRGVKSATVVVVAVSAAPIAGTAFVQQLRMATSVQSRVAVPNAHRRFLPAHGTAFAATRNTATSSTAAAAAATESPTTRRLRQVSLAFSMAAREHFKDACPFPEPGALEAHFQTVFATDVRDPAFWLHGAFESPDRSNNHLVGAFGASLERLSTVHSAFNDDVFAAAAFRAASAAVTKVVSTHHLLETDFVPGKKVPLPLSGVVLKSGLLDRDAALQQVSTALQYLSTLSGQAGLDKKFVPLMSLNARSEHGKTTFLKFIANTHCTFVPGARGSALLDAINASRPQRLPPLDGLVTLFGSYNQTSPLQRGEVDTIEHSTVERLLRSFIGIVDGGTQSSFEVATFDQLHDVFGPRVGLILCVDELAAVKKINPIALSSLLNLLLGFAQRSLSHGKFVAIIGSTLSFFDNKSVVTDSGRALLTIEFPLEAREMSAWCLKHIKSDTNILAPGTPPHKEMQVRGILSGYANAGSMTKFERVTDLPPAATQLQSDETTYDVPDRKTADEVFVLAGRTMFDEGARFSLHDQEAVITAMERFDGRGRIVSQDDLLYATEFRTYLVRLHAARVLQLRDPSAARGRLFTFVDSWPLNALRDVLYCVGGNPEKDWELATMALLEIRRGLFHAARNTPPTLQELFGGITILHNVGPEMLGASAAARFCELAQLPDVPTYDAACGDALPPTLVHASKQNAPAVEGVLLRGFVDSRGKPIAVFYQMKMYAARSVKPGQVTTWLTNMVDRAKQLGYPEDAFAVLLFMTGAPASFAPIPAWPKNAMVVPDGGVLELYNPFGAGLLPTVLQSKAAPTAST
jgi:hypothetical protein